MTAPSARRATSATNPYDIGINADPYLVFKRLREEAPVYCNAEHDFYAARRCEDCERG